MATEVPPAHDGVLGGRGWAAVTESCVKGAAMAGCGTEGATAGGGTKADETAVADASYWQDRLR